MALRRRQVLGWFVLTIAAGAIISACGPTGSSGPGIVNARSGPGAPVTGSSAGSTSTQVAPAETVRPTSIGTATTRPGQPGKTGVVPPRVGGATPPTTTAIGSAAVAGGAAIVCGDPARAGGPGPQCPPG